MKVIDFHTHNFPDALAPRAIASMLEKLEGRLPPVGDGTVARQLADMDRFGVDESVVCSLATKPTQFQVILDRAKQVRDGVFGEEAARRLHQLCSVHPADRAYAEHFREIARAGFRGVALHPYYMSFSLDDPRIAPFFAAIRDNGLFTVVHCGRDLGYNDAPMTCGPEQIAALLKRVPGVRFVAAHLGGTCANPPRATDRLLEFENCWFDTAVLNVDEEDAEAKRIMAEWPADRLVFGTDYFWRDEKRLADWVRENRPDPVDLDRIFHGNAELLLGTAARELTTESAFFTGRLADLERVTTRHAGLAKALDFLKRTDLSALASGRHEIVGDEVWAIVSDSQLAPFGDGKLRAETHGACIDIQTPLDGPETYGLHVNGDRPYEPFDAAKDIGFAEVHTRPLTLAPGEYVVFMPPRDGHAPCRALDGATMRRKLIVKIRK